MSMPLWLVPVPMTVFIRRHRLVSMGVVAIVVAVSMLVLQRFVRVFVAV